MICPQYLGALAKVFIIHTALCGGVKSGNSGTGTMAEVAQE